MATLGGVARIAHLTDSHLLEDTHHARANLDAFRLRFLSFGRPLDAAGRRARLRAALASAARARCDHLVLTGDLTEDGSLQQYEVLAEELDRSGIAPEHVTMLPGNHDLYTDPRAFERALAGPLSPWSEQSRGVVDLCDTAIVLLPTARGQHYALSAGEIDLATFERVRDIVMARRAQGKTVVLALHHPVRPKRTPMQWWDGLRNWALVHELLVAHTHAFALHGHIHRAVDDTLGLSPRARVFSAAAVVDAPEPLRVYHTAGGEMRAQEDTTQDLPATGARARSGS